MRAWHKSICFVACRTVSASLRGRLEHVKHPGPGLDILGSMESRGVISECGLLASSLCANAILQPDGLIVPLEWLAGSAPTFQQHVEEQLYFVELVKPTQLDAVFISALSAEAFDTASRDQSAFEAWFRQDERMIRQGAIYTLPSSFKEEADSSALYQYKVIMAEPVTQGYSTKDATQLFISNGHDLDQQASPLQDVIDDEEDSGEDEFEIDEGFLASSVLPRMTPASTRVTSPTLEQDSGHTRANGHNAGAGEVLDTLALWTAPLERIKSASDDHSVYLRTSEAGKLGILNGDWASRHSL